MRASGDVHNLLSDEGVPHEIVHLPSSSSTAQLAADALGVPVGEVVKSLVFVLDDRRPVMALVAGDATVDAGALAREAGAAEVRLARSGEVRELTGYQPGAVSPVALETDLPVIADPGDLRTGRRLLRRRHDDDHEDPQRRSGGAAQTPEGAHRAASLTRSRMAVAGADATAPPRRPRWRPATK